jgi:hypothetical protein
MQRLLLAHLSQQNNHPDIALSAFASHADTINVEIASRHQPSKLYSTDKPSENKTAPVSPVQLNMFDS